MKNAKIDMKELGRKAESSEHDESYETIEKNEHFKIGAGARLIQNERTYFIEVIIKLCEEGKKVDLVNLDDKIEVVKELKEIDFSPKCEDHNTICCEKEIQEDEFDETLKRVKISLKNKDRDNGVN